MLTQPTPDRDTLHALCVAANREAFALFERRNTCIVTSAALCDVLRTLGYDADLLRVEAVIFHGNGTATSAGSDGDGSRRPAAGPGRWHGHLAVVAARRFLLDPTLDQLAGGAPFTEEVTDAFLRGQETLWWGRDHRRPGFPRRGEPYIRYKAFPSRGGYKSKPAFRPSERRPLVAAILESLRVAA